MTLEPLGNELAKLLADIIHSLVSSKLEKMADRIPSQNFARARNAARDDSGRKEELATTE